MELLSLLSVVGFAVAWHRFRADSGAAALLQVVAAMLLCLYVGALLDLMFPMTLLLTGAGLLLLLVFAIQSLRQGTLPPATVVIFFGIALIYWLLQANSVFFYYDEYSHWGVFLREMLAGHRLWDGNTNSMHPRYVPGSALWQYYFAVFSNRMEGAAYLGQFVLLVSPLMVLWENIDWRRAGWVAGILILVTIALANFGHGYTSLYVDHLLGAWFAGVLLNFSLSVRAQKYRRLYYYIVPLAAIVLFKSTGLFFAVACSGLMGLLLLNRESSQTPKATAGPRLLKSAALPIAASLLCFALLGAWSVNRDAAGISKSVDSTGGIAGSLIQRESVLTDAEQQELTRRFVDVVLHHQISKDEMSAQFNAFSYSIMPLFEGSWRLTTATLLALSLAAIMLLWRWVVPDDRRTQWLITGCGTWLMAVAYIAVLYLGYRYIANDRKALELSSYVRYAHSMLLPLVIVTFSPLLPAFGDDRGPRVQVGQGLTLSRNALVFAVALAAFSIIERPYLKPLYTVQEPPLLRRQLEPMTAGIRSTIDESSLWVYFPNNMENGFVGQLLQYLLTPGRTYVEERADRLLYDPESLKPELGNFHYAWFPAQSPEIDAALEELAGELSPTRLFRVVVSGNDLRLEAVQETQPQTLAEID